MAKPDVALVGPVGNAHVGSSLARAAADLGLAYDVFDTAPAYEGPLLARKVAWHLFGRRPWRRRQFSHYVQGRLEQVAPRAVITVGQAPLMRGAIEALRAARTRTCNFSTDDPFNRRLMAPWHLADLPAYDVVFTPRRANMQELRELGCADVRYLPFGYDDHLYGAPVNTDANSAGVHPVLFVGGADADRARFFQDFSDSGLPVALAGGYWERFSPPGARVLGLLRAEEIGALTATAVVNICLVRRANRDGHVMRSFEIPSVGGFMLAEDTQEHRDLFGTEGACVLYFRTPAEAAEKCRWAMDHADERLRMAAAARALIAGGGNTYRDRLRAMLEVLAQ